MDRSLTHGTPSSLTLVEAEAIRNLCFDERIVTLQEVLGDAELYLVGGTIRDALIGRPTHDFDLATNRTPEEVGEALTRRGIRVIETGLHHGTVTALVDDTPVEITTYRKPNPQNLPLFSTTIEEDISGRDFTVNALACSCRDGSLVDLYGGVEDIRTKTIRGVGDPLQRFTEDPLRIMRMVRFGDAQSWKVEAATRAAARSVGKELKRISVERIREELCKSLLSPTPSKVIRALRELEILEIVLPELVPCIGVEQNEYHTEDVFDHTMSVLDRCPEGDLPLRLAAIFHDIGKPATISTGEDGRRHFYLHEVVSTDLCQAGMKRLKFSNEMIDKVSTIVRYHMRPIECGPSGVRRLMRDLGDEFEPWRSFKYADKTPVMGEDEFLSRMQNFQEMVENERERLAGQAIDTPVLNGHDIMSLGVPSGRGIGRVLSYLTDVITEDPSLNERESLMELAKRFVEEGRHRDN